MQDDDYLAQGIPVVRRFGKGEAVSKVIGGSAF
jgi:hypothetical protein